MHRTTRAGHRRRGSRDERGAVALEAALVLPVIMLLVFGMIDMALLMRDYVSVTAATRAATRISAAEADAGPCVTQNGDTTTCPSTSPPYVPEVAQDAADTMQKNLAGVPSNSVNFLLVYEANKNGFPCLVAANCNPLLTATPDVNTTMPTSCAGVYVNCIKFTWSPSANSGKGAFRYSAGGSSTGGWDSRTISACVNKEDSIGVYVSINHAWVTGMIANGTFTLTDKSVMKFEPLSDDTCDSTKISAHP